MEKIRKGDKVGRISHGEDIIFEVKKIIKLENGKKIAILKGITERIEVDSDVEDLKTIEKEKIENNLRCLEQKLEERIEKVKTKNQKYKKIEHRMKEDFITGKILHLDGDCIFVYTLQALYAIILSGKQADENIKEMR